MSNRLGGLALRFGAFDVSSFQPLAGAAGLTAAPTPHAPSSSDDVSGYGGGLNVCRNARHPGAASVLSWRTDGACLGHVVMNARNLPGRTCPRLPGFARSEPPCPAPHCPGHTRDSFDPPPGPLVGRRYRAKTLVMNALRDDAAKASADTTGDIGRCTITPPADRGEATAPQGAGRPAWRFALAHEEPGLKLKTKRRRHLQEPVAWGGIKHRYGAISRPGVRGPGSLFRLWSLAWCMVWHLVQDWTGFAVGQGSSRPR